MPVRSLIEFKVNPGAEQAFEAAYLKNGFLDRARSRAGFLSGEFLSKGVGTSTYWAIAQWNSRADYEAWQEAYFDVFSGDELHALGQHLAATPKGFVTEIIRSVSADQ